MNSGQPPPPPHQKDSGEPFNWKLRPTLQLKIKANSWNEFRPTPPQKDSGEPFSWILRPTLQLKIKANSWNKGSAENSHELTWRRLFSFQLILVQLLHKEAIVTSIEVCLVSNKKLKCRQRKCCINLYAWSTVQTMVPAQGRWEKCRSTADGLF